MKPLPIIAIRPEPGLSATIRTASGIDLEVQGFPLFEVQPVDWTLPDPRGYRGLLAGSANLFRHGGDGLESLRALPVHAVGRATAQAARKAGFTVASTGEGGLQAVVETLVPGRYLRLSGEVGVDLDLPGGIEAETLAIYRVVPRPIPASLAATLREGGLVLLHSGEAARHFASACDDAGIGRANISLACLAPRIAEAAGAGWARVAFPAERSDAALLALAKQMCQTT